MARNNPHGANQYVVDPRQTLFLSYYLDPKSKTFANCLQSALKAKFSYEYAKNLSAKMPTWLTEKVGKVQMLKKAERNLDEFLDLNTKNRRFNPDGEITEYEDSGLVRAKLDATKFVASKLGGEWKDEEKDVNVGVTVNIVSYGQSDRLHRTVQLDAGTAPIEGVAEPSAVQDSRMAPEGEEDHDGDQRTLTLGSD